MTERSAGSWNVLAPHGALDLASVPALRTRARRSIDRGAVQVAIDLSDVDFIDSTGVGALLGIRRRAIDAGGAAVLVGVDHRMMTTLELFGVAEVLSVAPSAESLP